MRGSRFAALAAALGCTSTSTQPGDSDSGLPIEASPVTYAGTIPCASCPGIAWTLTLLEDGTYRLRRTYLESGGTDRTRVEGAVDPAPLTGTFWRLTELPSDETFAVDPALRAHLMLADGRVSGSSGCNRITGTFTAHGAAITFAQLAGTRMACAPAAMELERRVYAALESAERYAIDGEILVLSGADGPVARFERYLE